jgi:hypothetical protein
MYSLIEAFVYLSQSVDEKATSIKRLLRVIFGAKTETRKKLFKIGSKPKRGRDPERRIRTKEANWSRQKRR